jgi:hypothetical protein
LGGPIKFNITNKFGFTVVFLNTINSDVDYGRSFFNPVTFHKFRNANGRDDNIGPTDDFS